MTHENYPSTPEDRLYKIVEDGICIGCGLCQSVAPKGRISVRPVPNGELRPVVTAPLTHEDVDRIYDTCPGTRLEGLPDSLIKPDTKEDLIWGPYRRIITGFAKDPAIRHRAATAGVLTALSQYLLASNQVASIVHAKPGKAPHAGHGLATVSRTKVEVLEGAGSRYGPTAVLSNINSIIELGEPFAFVGKPCDIAALRNLAKIDSRVNDLVRYWLTPVCGGFMPEHGLNDFLTNRMKADPSEVTHVSYRGYGCPGPTQVTLTSGETKSMTYLDMWGDGDGSWVLPFRCKVCPDGIGEGADIAASDTWPGGSPKQEDLDTDLGLNALVVRTEAGEQLVKDAQKAGYLSLEDEVDPRQMDDWQPHQRAKKLAVRARHDGLAAGGATVPRTRGLRLDELAEIYIQEQGKDAYDHQREGTKRRFVSGKSRESRPR